MHSWARFSFLMAISVTSVLSSPDSVAQSPITLTTSELETLETGELIIRPIPLGDKPGQAYDLFGLMPHPKERIFDAVNCLAEYPTFMPNIERIEIVSQDQDQMVANFYLALPMNQSKQYRLQMAGTQSNEQLTLSWRLVDWPELAPGDTIRDSTGHWRLQSYTHPDYKTLVHYQVYTDPGDIPFGLGWIVDLLTRVSLPDIFDATKSHIDSMSSDCRHNNAHFPSITRN